MIGENIYEKEYEIKYYEQNLRGALKESSLLNFLQDVATLSAESLGFGPTFVFVNQYAWVVLRYHIEIYKDIKDITNIIIKTQPRGTSKLFAFRDFEFYSNEDVLLGKVVSTWMLIDVNTRRPLPTQKVLSMMPIYEKRQDDLEYSKIDNFETVTYKKEFDVRFDDIDVNKHANNCNYIIWALEALPNDFRLNHYPKTIDIKYQKETGLGSKVLSEVFVENDCSLHRISENGEELCSLRIEWQ